MRQRSDSHSNYNLYVMFVDLPSFEFLTAVVTQIQGSFTVVTGLRHPKAVAHVQLYINNNATAKLSRVVPLLIESHCVKDQPIVDMLHTWSGL